WLSGQKLSEEDTKNGAISAAGAPTGAINVEKAQRERRQAIDLSPVQRELFAQIFGQCVRVASVRRRRLGCWIGRRNAVARRGCHIDKALHCVPPRGLEHNERSVHVTPEIGLGLRIEGTMSARAAR